MIKIGLTGGIASGKSTAAAFFEKEGFFVISADKVAKEVSRKGEEGYKKIINTFGKDILDKTGEINRKKLANIIFKDKSKKIALEKILHPIIRHRIRKITDEAKGKEDVVIIEIPLLFETGMDKEMDLNILIYSPPSKQIERLIERDGISEEEAIARIENQLPIDEKKKLSDIVVENTSSLEFLEKEIKDICRKIKISIKAMKQAIKLGAMNVKFISPKKIKIAHWVRLKCMYGCPDFAKVKTCPPYTPDADYMKKVISEYNFAILMISESHDTATKLAREVMFFLYGSGIFKAMGFGSGRCRLCDTCTPEDCKYPELAIPSMEACSMDVFGTAQNANMDPSTVNVTNPHYSLVLIS